MKKISENQQGIAHLLLILILIIVAAIVVIGVVVVGRNNSSNKTGLADVSNTDKACQDKIHDQDFCKFAVQYNKLDNTPVQVTMTSQEDKGTSTINFKQDGKGNMEASMNAGGKEVTLDVIKLNGFTYGKSPTGAWTKYPDSSLSAPFVDEPLKDMNLFNGTKDYDEGGSVNYKKIGTEACGSITCFKYQVIDQRSPQAKTYIWFDTKNYMFRHMQYKDQYNVTQDMTIEYPPIKITAPDKFTVYKGA
ncbi:MAG TPA: hypothetical protein VFP35_00365 [Candidatus Saccharimonadales bacterium]|nr:hypothetical protein [Candidatus Saccharimonadales bacterium]